MTTWMIYDRISGINDWPDISKELLFRAIKAQCTRETRPGLFCSYVELWQKTKHVFNPQNLLKTVKCDGVSGTGRFPLGFIMCSDYFVMSYNCKIICDQLRYTEAGAPIAT